MNVFILLVGTIILAIAITSLVEYRSIESEIHAIKATDSSTIGELQSLNQAVIDELGQTGAWRQPAELKGRVSSSNPLRAKLSRRSCVYCHTVIKEEYEKTEYDTDDDGNTTSSTSRGSKVISDNVTQINFYLEDETGKILIDLAGAQIDGLTVVNDFEPERRTRTGRKDYRILGYQKTEKIIALESRIYIIGEVSDRDGQLQVCASEDKDTPFIISYRSEAELLKFKQSRSRQKLAWGIVLSILSIIAIIYSLSKILA